MSLYLGFDLSTQQLKIVACQEDLSFHSKFTLTFDDHYKSQFNINKGVITNEETGEIVTPVAVFISAFQQLLDEMKEANFPFYRVKSISGSAQQHGTVYYTSSLEHLLQSLSPISDIWYNDLADAFSYPTASNWQDRSTSIELDAFHAALGSADELCHRTGSKAHFRFSGPQMRRRARIGGKQWQNTARMGLISGLVDTLLTGIPRGVEMGEACGTNLMDIQTGDWDDELLSLVILQNAKVDGVTMEQQQHAASRVKSMLGDVVKPNESASIAPYLIQRYGFSEDCQVWPITGDNLATIMALPLGRDDLLISMGTSTTVLLLTEKYAPSVNYHVFRHPVCDGVYMGMLCYCNGALAREQVRDAINEKYNTQAQGWDKFDEVLNEQYAKELSTLNTAERVGIYFPLGEIIPNAKPSKRRWEYSSSKGLVELSEDEVSIEEEAKLIIESQALSCRLRVCPMLSDPASESEAQTTNAETNGNLSLETIVGDTVTVDNVPYPVTQFMKRPQSVYYVGGSSSNKSITRVFNDVLGAKCGGYGVEIGDACALGGCFRAIWGSTTMTTEEGYEAWIQRKFDTASNLERIGEDVKRDEYQVKQRWAQFAGRVGVLSLAEKELES